MVPVLTRLSWLIVSLNREASMAVSPHVISSSSASWMKIYWFYTHTHTHTHTAGTQAGSDRRPIFVNCYEKVI